jgi:hypothetical protein
VIALREALREAETREHAFLTIRAAEVLGRAELARGRASEAETAARRALAKADSVDYAAGRHRLHALLARILEGRGQNSAAAAEWERGRLALARVRATLTDRQRAALDALPEVREIDSKGAAPAATRS